MPARTKKAVSTEPRALQTSHIEILRGVAEAAGDDELVKHCGLALRDNGSARQSIEMEIDHRPHAVAFNKAVMEG